MRKNKQKLVFLFLLLTFMIIFLTGCSNQEEDINNKLSAEIEFMDNNLISMLNKVNHIQFQNYSVTAEKIEESESSNSEGSQSSSSGSSSEGGSSQSDSAESEGDSSSGSEGGGSKQSSEGSKSNNVEYKMQPSGILTGSKDTNWDELKSDIENFYSSWSIITLDLYKQNINSKDILNFNSELDSAIIAIKNEDKQATLNTLSKLYSYIPIYANSFLGNDATESKVYQTKSNVLNAYAQVEENKQEVLTQLTQAENAYMSILNNIEGNSTKQGEINKIYILLKDMQSSGAEDTDVFYIKYRNLMEQLNNLG